MKILYVTSGAMWKTSGNSIQVLDELEELNRNGHQVDLLLLVHRSLPRALESELANLRSRLQASSSRLHIQTLMRDQLTPFPSLQLTAQAWQLSRLVKREGYELVSGHTIRSGLIAARSKRLFASCKHVAYDMHGVGIAEEIYSGRLQDGEGRQQLYSQLESEILRDSDLVFVVSRVFKQWVQDEYGTPAERIWVTPSSTTIKELPSSEWRMQKRRELGIGERPVLLYSGSLLSWQRAEDLIRLFARIRLKLPGLFLLMYTKADQQAGDLIRAAGVPAEDFAVRSLSPGEVQGMMSIGDIGALLRHDHLVNNVASPVKFADYLGAGLPVLLAPGVGDASHIVREEQVGCVWEEEREDLDHLVVKLRALLEARDDRQRERCRQVAHAHFSWTETVKTFNRAFAQLESER